MKITRYSRSKLLSLASCMLLLGSSLPAAAFSGGTDYFLKFDGIKGGSSDKLHRDWSDINSFSWGVSAIAGSVGGGGGAGKTTLSDFAWTQALDSSFTPLFLDTATGKHIKKAVVDFSTVAEKPLVYFKMTFDDVQLTSLNLAGSAGSDPSFAGSFAYGKVTLDYWEQKADGSLGAKSTASYDLKKGVGSAAAVAAVYAQGLMGPQVAAVPEPESYAMLLAGLGVIGFAVKRRREA